MQPLSTLSPRQCNSKSQLRQRLLVSILFIFGIAGAPHTAVAAAKGGSNACTIIHNPTACTSDQSFATDGAFTKDGTATDNTGFFSSTNFGPIQIDKTAPSISATATKADATAYTAGSWSNQDITVSYTCSENGSELAGACPATRPPERQKRSLGRHSPESLLHRRH